MTVAQLRRMWACLSDSWKEKLAGTSENPAVQQIALKAGKRFRSELAKNPSLDAGVLSGLMDDKSNDVQKCLATNPCLSEEQIRQLFSGGDPSTISELALRSDLPADLLEKMLSSKSQNISYAALWSPSATPQMVEDL